MAETTLQGSVCNTNSSLPEVGNKAPDFTLTNMKLKNQSLGSFEKRWKFIYSVPSLDTMVCANTVKKLNEIAVDHDDTDFIVISADLSFAQQRFCKQNKLKKITPLSTMRSDQFAIDYGLKLVDGVLEGLLARAVLIMDEKNDIAYQELVADIANEPDFDAAFAILKN